VIQNQRENLRANPAQVLVFGVPFWRGLGIISLDFGERVNVIARDVSPGLGDLALIVGPEKLAHVIDGVAVHAKEDKWKRRFGVGNVFYAIEGEVARPNFNFAIAKLIF